MAAPNATLSRTPITTFDAPDAMRDTLALVARILLAFMFVTSGWDKLIGFSGTAGFIASRGLPLPTLATAIAVICELGIGLMLLVGFKARWAGIVLAVFTVAAGILFHDYWNMSGADVMANKINFMKNISIAGGMLAIAAFGPGRYSVDRR